MKLQCFSVFLFSMTHIVASQSPTPIIYPKIWAQAPTELLIILRADDDLKTARQNLMKQITQMPTEEPSSKEEELVGAVTYYKVVQQMQIILELTLKITQLDTQNTWHENTQLHIFKNSIQKKIGNFFKITDNRPNKLPQPADAVEDLTEYLS